ncbi:MAG: methylated-DNA--[protein]-cysteine S-methyltransferase [Chloroflexota bacterium]
MELKYATFQTTLGWVGVMASANGLVSTTLPQPNDQAARQSLGISDNQAVWDPEEFGDLDKRLQAYFSGQKVAFTDKLDLSGATPFESKVWKTTQLIPHGMTRSYLWIARQMKKPRAARAVGQALGRNPLHIIVPCHRVIASNGTLGGFGGGLALKRYLLRLEAPKPAKTRAARVARQPIA